MSELMPNVRLTVLDPNGAPGTPLSGGKLYSYEAGSTTPLAVFKDRLETTPHTNPIVLDSNGQCSQIWIKSATAYKFVCTDSNDVVLWTEDDITGMSPLFNAGTGDVSGPGSSVNNELPLFSGTTGKILKRASGTGIAKLINGVLNLIGIDLGGLDVTGILPINKGGTGADTPNNALNAILPAQAGMAGKFLKTDSTNTSWEDVPSGVPAGGAAGALLSKVSAADQDLEWKQFEYSGYSARFNQAFSSTDLNDTLSKILNLQYTPPAISLAGSGSSTIREKGAPVSNVTLTATVTKKSDPIAAVRFYQGATLLDTKTGTIPNGGTETTVFAGPFSDNISFTAQVDDNGASGGPTTVTSASLGYTFVYPYYQGPGAVGLSAAAVAGLTKEVIASTSNKVVTFAASAGQVFYFAYPASYPALTSILDVNNFETLPDWTASTANITGLDGTPQSYRIYEFKNPVVAGSYQYTFKR